MLPKHLPFCPGTLIPSYIEAPHNIPLHIASPLPPPTTILIPGPPSWAPTSNQKLLPLQLTFRTSSNSPTLTFPPHWPFQPPTTSRDANVEDNDEEEIMRKALKRVQRVKERKAEEKEEERKKAAAIQAGEARRKAAQEARDRADRARQQEAEIVERRWQLAGAVTARSQWETSPSEASVSPRRPVVEVTRMTKSKGKGKEMAKAKAGGTPATGNPKATTMMSLSPANDAG
ncbi:hypothetical protein EV368DRAFT_88292 [Lentinula lateritia]|nr:hypothetical protein EV368DRAFT_88292 [Lentinula lateritia]